MLESSKCSNQRRNHTKIHLLLLDGATNKVKDDFETPELLSNLGNFVRPVVVESKDSLSLGHHLGGDDSCCGLQRLSGQLTQLFEYKDGGNSNMMFINVKGNLVRRTLPPPCMYVPVRLLGEMSRLHNIIIDHGVLSQTPQCITCVVSERQVLQPWVGETSCTGRLSYIVSSQQKPSVIWHQV